MLQVLIGLYGSSWPWLALAFGKMKFFAYNNGKKGDNLELITTKNVLISHTKSLLKTHYGKLKGAKFVCGIYRAV